jgi:hypothetical protein
VQDRSGPVGDGEIVVAGGDTAPLLEQGEGSFDDNASLYASATKPRGLPPSGP